MLLRLRKYFIILLMLAATDAASQQQTMTEQQYRSVITTFVKENADGLIAQLRSNAGQFQRLFAPCLDRKSDGVTAVQRSFNSQLVLRIQSSITKIFRQPTEAQKYFGGRSLLKVVRDAQSEINSSNTKKQINDFVTAGCGSGPVPPTRNNASPKADAGDDLTITLPRNYVLLRGTGSDPDKDTLAFKWSKLPNTDNERIISPASSQTRIENLHDGRHQYVLSVSDSRGGFDSDTVIVIVQPGPPTVNAGNDIVITLPVNTVTLNGSGTDPNGSALTYSWSKISGGAGDRIISNTTPQTVVENLQSGTYQYLLTVTNRYQLTARDIVQVRVNDQPNRPPTVEAGPDITIALPVNRVELTGHGTDPDNDRLTYRWIKLSGPESFRFGSAENSQTIIDNLAEGTYYFIVAVTDDHHPAVRDTVMVTVNPKATGTQPPTADAGPDQVLEFSKDSVIILSGSGKDSDGTITSYQWIKKSGPDSIRIISPAKAQTTLDVFTPGEYLFELTVTDNDGLIDTDTVLLKINASTKPAWIWILIGIIGLGIVSSVTIYFLGLWRKPKIIAYYLNETEKNLVHKLMPESHKTEGYSVGRVSRKKIKTMEKEGLAVRILNTNRLVVSTPGMTTTYNYSLRKGTSQPKVTKESHQGNFENLILSLPERNKSTGGLPAFYIITLDTPLLPAFRNKLEAIDVNIVQHVPFNSYIILIKDHDQLQKLKEKNFEFIRMIKPYTPEDTGFMVRKDRFIANTSSPQQQFLVDLILHREEDGAQVRDFLDTNKIETIASYKNIIRIRMQPNTDLAAKLASNKYIQAIYECVRPAFHNDFARRLVGIDPIKPGESYVTENGDGQIIAIADSGIDRDHPDLTDRIVDAVSWGRKDKDTKDPHGHGTHVTGSIVGNGKASKGTIKGIAPGAKVYFQSILDEEGKLCDLELQLPKLLQQAYEHEARIFNISWGSDTESFYTFESLAMDRFIYEHPEMLVVVSAGNEGKLEKDSDGIERAVPGSVGSPATTKNGLTVGASQSNRNKEDPEVIANFSGRGPCGPERRVKPDIIAPGTNILSTKSSIASDKNFQPFSGNPAYVFMGGTSMATPIVSGAAALVREYYKKRRKYPNPSAALIKATLLNGTKKLSSDSAMQGTKIIPNNNQGYGMLDLSMTIPNSHSSLKLEYFDSMHEPAMMFRQVGEIRLFKLVLRKKAWLRTCLVFLDNPVIGIQSNLDLIISLDGTSFKWTGNAGINVGDQYFSKRIEDTTNSIEIVRIDNAEPGSYTIAVIVTNAARDINLGFALVVTTGDLSGEFSVERG